MKSRIINELLIRPGVGVRELARELGCAPSYVTAVRKLLDMGPERPGRRHGH